MGMFINIKIKEGFDRSENCIRGANLCPVDIFSQDKCKVHVIEENVDECTLCGLCTDACPDGIVIEKNY